MKRFFLTMLLAMWAVAISATSFAQDVKNGQKIYKVKKGDWLSTIAKKNNLDWRYLYNANPWIANPNLIYPSQELVIPPPPPTLPDLINHVNDLTAKLEKLGEKNHAAAQRAEAAAEKVEKLLAEFNASEKNSASASAPAPALHALSHTTRSNHLRPSVKFAAYHFQASAERTGGRRIFNEGAFFALTVGDWLRASSGTESGQFARVSVSPLLPTIWKNQYFQLRTGLNTSLISQDAHFDTQAEVYTFGHINGCLGMSVVVDLYRGRIRVDWLGIGNNVRPQDETVYYSWLGGLQNTRLYPVELSLDLGKGFAAALQGLGEGKKLNVPYFLATLEKQVFTFPSFFSRATRLSAYAGYGEVKMAGGPSNRSRGVILGCGIGF